MFSLLKRGTFEMYKIMYIVIYFTLKNLTSISLNGFIL